MTDIIDGLDAARARGLGQPKAWPEPEPLTESEPPPSEFPMASLGPLQSAAADIQRTAKCPPALAAASVLAVASLAAQGRFDVSFKGQPRPLSLFILTIAPSGERKSTADRLAGLGIDRHEEALRRAARQDRQAQEAGIDPPAPILPSVIRMNDGTIEGIVQGFVEGHPSQTLSTDEAGRFLSGHSMQREHKLKALASLSKFWDASPDAKRIKGKGPQSETHVIRDHRLSVHLQGQRVAIAPFLHDPIAQGQGLLARFLVHEPASLIGTRTETPEEWNQEAFTPAILAFAGAVESHLAAAAKRDSDGAVTRPVLPLEPDASNALRLYFNEIESKLGFGGDLSGKANFANKVHENAARLGGVLATFRQESTVTRESMLAGIRIADYFLAELIRLAELAPGDEAASKALTIARWLHSRGGTFPTREFSRQGPKGLRTIGDRKDAMNLLEEAGWLRSDSSGLTLNPKCAEQGLLNWS